MENKKSPYYQPQLTAGALKSRLLKHLDLLVMPKAIEEHDHTCERDCHIIERNHTIETIRQFINGEGVDNSTGQK